MALRQAGWRQPVTGGGGDSVVGLSGGAVLWSGGGRDWLDLNGPFAAMTIDLKGGVISQGSRVIGFAPVVGVRGFAYRRIGNQAAVVCGGDRAGRLDGSLMNDLLQAGSGDDLATTGCKHPERQRRGGGSAGRGGQ